MPEVSRPSEVWDERMWIRQQSATGEREFSVAALGRQTTTKEDLGVGLEAHGDMFRH